MQASLGPTVGKAYVPGHGVGIVFSEGHDHFTIQTRDGRRLFTHRDKIQWRR